METIREELSQHQIAKIESIKARIAELDEYKIDLENFYNKLKSELGKKVKVEKRILINTVE